MSLNLYPSFELALKGNQIHTCCVCMRVYVCLTFEGVSRMFFFVCLVINDSFWIQPKLTKNIYCTGYRAIHKHYPQTVNTLTLPHTCACTHTCVCTHTCTRMNPPTHWLKSTLLGSSNMKGPPATPSTPTLNHR